MTQIGEKQIRLAAKFYEVRDSARIVLGDGYAADIANAAKILRAVQAQEGTDLIQASLTLCKKASADGHPHAVMVIIAATVEIAEGTA